MARRWYRDPRTGRFISRAEWERQRATRRDQAVRRRRQQERMARLRVRPPRRRFTEDEERLLDDLRQSVRDRVFAAGTEFELTATTKGGTPRRR